MDKKMQIRIILKNGADFILKCDKFNGKKNGAGQITEIEWEGGTENIPLYLDTTGIVAIIQLEG